MIIRPDDIPETLQEPRPLALKRVVNIDAHTDQISVTWARLWGYHDRVLNQISDRVYYIIEGSARFQVGDGTPVETVKAGDFVFIPRDVAYEFEGEMRYLVMNGPAYRTASDIVQPRTFV
jgi:mannose-6-phosphate isomerase-like protein (cupin superfamily)